MGKLRKKTVDRIIALLGEGWTDVEIAEKAGVSRQTVAKYRVDPNIPGKDSHKAPPPDREWEQIKPIAIRLMRVTGTATLKEAMEQAEAAAIAFNPYLLNHGLRDPGALMEHFRAQISRLEDRNTTLMGEAASWKYRFEDDAWLLAQLGVDRVARVVYQYMRDYLGVPDGWGGFISSCVLDALRSRGYEIARSRIGRPAYYVTPPEGRTIRYTFPEKA